MAKKKTVYIDPAYYAKYGDLGKSIRQANLEDLARRRNDPYEYVPQDDEIMDYYDPEYYNASDTTTNEEGIGDKIGNFFKGVGNDINDAVANTAVWTLNRTKWIDDLVYMTRERQLQGQRDTAAGKASEDAHDLDLLNGLNDFINKQKQYRVLENNLITAKNNQDEFGTIRAQNEINNFLQANPTFLSDAEMYRKEIRTNPTLQRMFFNTDTGDFFKDRKITAKAYLDDFVRNTSITEEDVQKYNNNFKLFGPHIANFISSSKYLLNVAGTVFNDLFQPVFKPVDTAIQSLRKKLTGRSNEVDYAHNDMIRKYIANTNDEEDLKSLQKIDLYNINDAQQASIQEEIQRRVNEKQESLNEHTIEYADYVNKLNNGTILYDPDAIDPRLRNMVDNNKIIGGPNSLIDALVLNIPEIGTSFSDMQSFIGTIATGQAANMLANSIQYVLPGSNVGKFAGLGVKLLGNVAALGFTVSGRESETAQEAIGAWTDKVYNNLSANNINIQDLKPELIHNAAQQGINLSKASDDDLIKYAIAFNIKTSNPVFNELVKQSHNGINGVIARNNALAYSDLIQTIPFLNTGGIFKKLGNQTKDILSDAVQPLGEKLKLQAAKAWMDKRINKIADRVGLDIANKIAIKNTTKNIVSNAKKLGFVAAGEGVEEGQQMYISQQYQQGLYDDEDAAFSNMFDINHVVDNNKLAFESLLSYFGLNFGDPLNGDEELRRSMESGALTGLFFAGGGQVVQSTFERKNPIAPVTDMIRDFKNDKFLIRRMSDNYGKQNRELQASVLFDSYNRGMTYDKVINAFDQLKGIVDPSYASNEDIEDAKKVAGQTYRAYTKTLNSDDTTLSDLKINPFSEDHKEFVRAYVSAVSGMMDSSKLDDASSKEIQDKIDDIVKNLNDTEYLKQNPLYSSVVDKLKLYYDSHVRAQQEEIANIEKQISDQKDLQDSTQNDESLNEDQKLEKISQIGENISNLNKRLFKIKADSQVQDFNKVRDNVFKLMYLQARQSSLTGLQAKLLNQSSRLKQLEKLGKTKLETRGLLGILSNVSKLQNLVTEQLNKIIDELIDDSESDPKQRSILRKQLLNQYGFMNPWMSSDQNGNFRISDQSLNDAFIIQALNNGVAQIYTQKAAAYEMLKADPKFVKNNIKNIKFVNLTQDQQNAFKQDIIREKTEAGESVDNINFNKEWDNYVNKTLKDITALEKELQKLNKQQNSNNGLLQSEYDRRVEDLQKKAALLLIQDELSDRNRLRKLNRESEQVNNPITNDELDLAQDGDKDAQQRVNTKIDSKIESPETGSPRSKSVAAAEAQLKKAKQDAGLELRDEDRTDEDNDASSIQDVINKGDVPPENIEDLNKWLTKHESDELQINAAQTQPESLMPAEKEEKGVGIQIDLEGKDAEPYVQMENEESEILQNQKLNNDEINIIDDKTDNISHDAGTDKYTSDKETNDDVSEDDIIQNDKESSQNQENFTEIPKNEIDVVDLNDDRKTVQILSPDISELDVNNDGSLNINGQALTSEQSIQVFDEQKELQSIENFALNLGEKAVDDLNVGAVEELGKKHDDEASKKEIPLSFNYSPYNTNPMKFLVNGKDLFSDYTIATGFELNTNLSIPGWLEQVTTKFYVVTGNNDRTPDDLTVSLMLVDPKNSKKIYPVTLRTPSKWYKKRGANKYTGEENLTMFTSMITDLRFKNVDYDLFLKNLNRKIEKLVDKINQLASQSAVKHNAIAKQYTVDDFRKNINGIYEQNKDEYNKLYEKARLESKVRWDATVYTENQIDDYVKRLTDLRNRIIDAYCTKNESGYIIPEIVRTDIIPSQVTQSHGSLNSTDDFRLVVGQNAGFEISDDIQEIGNQILSGDVQIGVGTGALSNDPFTIKPINGGENIPGKGYAGKIYLVLPDKIIPGYKEGDNPIPMILTEKKFYINGEPIDQSAFQESFDENGNYTGDGEISSAELIFRLMLTQTGYNLPGSVNLNNIVINKQNTGKLVSSNTTLTKEQATELLNMMVFHGKYTMLSFGKEASQQQKIARQLPYYANKQLGIREWNGEIVFSVGDANERYGVRNYKISELFPGKNATEDQKSKARSNRKQIISQISKNMHWNTELRDDDNHSAMDKPFSNTFKELLTSYFFSDGKRIEGRNVFNPFFNQDLQFNYEDFFDESGQWKNPLMLAWMLKTGKLTTNIGTGVNDIFDAPFVYAVGVNKPSVIQKTAHQKAQEVAKEDHIISTTKKSKKQKLEPTSKPVTSVNGVTVDYGNLNITQTIPEKYPSVERLASRKELEDRNNGLPEEKQLVDILLLNLDKWDKDNSSYRNAKEHYQNLIDKKVKDIEDNYKVNGKNVKMHVGLTGNVGSKSVVLVYVFANGEAFLHVPRVGFKFVKDRKHHESMFPTGVFSTERGSGKIDVKKGREWLSSALGLSSEQIIVTHGVERSASGSEVFGATRIAVNAITGELFPYITFSAQAGSGVDYHEAFHLVNLLLHNPKMRQKIYDEWVKKHPEDKSLPIRQIEENIAEDFRYYMLGYDDNQKSPRLIRFFKNIVTFLRTFFTHGKTITDLYRSIRKGKYKGQKLDPESVREFQRVYDNGASFEIPGVPNHKIKKFKTISDYHMYYECANQILNLLISGLDMSTTERISTITNDDFKAVFDDIRVFASSDDEYVAGIAKDVLENKDAFESTVKQLFNRFGVTAVKGKKKLDKNNENGKDSGDVADNIWDIDHLEVSGKDNVSFKAKLFLSTVPELKVELNDDGTRDYTAATDGIFEAPQYVSYDESWNKIKDDLWDCDSFDALNNTKTDYDVNSIMYRVENLSKTDKFYEALRQKLEVLIDPEDDSMLPSDKLEVKTQIFNTIVGFKNHILTMQISQPVHKTAPIDQDVAATVDLQMSSKNQITEDVNKMWTLLDSSNLHAIYGLPSKWSRNFATSSGAVISNGGKTYISSKYIKHLDTLINKLRNYTNTRSQYADLSKAKRAAIRLLNYMGIPYDDVTLQQYIDTECSKRIEQNKISVINGNEELSVLRELIQGKKQLGVGAKGSISKFIADIRAMYTNKTTQIRYKSTIKDVDDLYKGFAKSNKGDNQITNLALAYAKVHPSSSEFSVTGANGVQLYPFNQNNFMSDRTRQLKHNTQNIIQNMMHTSQCGNSLLLQVANEFQDGHHSEDSAIKLNSFVCLRDTDSGESGDYFGITPLEDYIAKMVMTYHKQLPMPTMADKKTWYSISSDILSQKLTDEVLAPFGRKVDNDGNISRTYDHIELSSNTVQIFKGYFIDELNTLGDYYSEENIRYLLNNPGKLILNFHGNIKKYPDGTPYFDVSGNGGKFRYFYEGSAIDNVVSIMEQELNLPKDTLKGINANQMIEYLFQVEHEMNNTAILNNNKPTDGFDLIRNFLKLFANFVSDSNNQSTKIYNEDAGRSFIESLVDEFVENNILNEIRTLSYDENIKLFDLVDNETLEMQNNISRNGKLIGGRVPKFMIEHYRKLLKSQETTNSMASSVPNAIYSLIANHVIRSMISTIETEKVYTGDPAFYKWKYFKSQELPESVKNKFKFIDENGSELEYEVNVLKEKYIDKIKRLGSVLSPGTNLKTQWSEDDYQDNENLLQDFHTSKYTFADLQDVTYESTYIPVLEEAFKKSEIANMTIQNNPEITTEELEKIYSADKKHLEKIFNNLKKEEQKLITSHVNSALSPYKEVNVADAEVLLRPAIYRKLRIAVGEWSFEPDDSGYSDEIAYNMVEKDGSWMSDPEKYKIASRLMLKPLKMTYFQNDITTSNSNSPLIVPIYDKMAMFPMFKFMCTSKTGRDIYERMNRKGNEIDMFGFESAVKVGGNKDRVSLYNKNENGVVKDLTRLGESINYDSDQSIDYSTGKISTKNSKKPLLAIKVQDLNNLRLQLNTDAHEATERAVGTQMAKVAFSNIREDFRYGENQKLGSEIVSDILNLIIAMTVQGREEVFKRFFKKTADGKYNTPNEKAIKKYLMSICGNNGLSQSDSEILQHGGTVASLTSRKLFENSVSSFVNGKVVDINTNGGSAVQQSVIGMIGQRLPGKKIKNYDSSIDTYQQLNGGNGLKWYRKSGTLDGTMEVFLSMNFFRHVVPKKYQTDYTTMRKWLLDNNVIGPNAKPFGVGYRIPTQGMSSTFAFVVADILPPTSGDLMVVPAEFTSQTGSDYDVDKIYIATYSYDRTDDTSVRSSGYNGRNNYTVEEYANMTSNQLKNKLIDNYIDVLGDYKNLSSTRASIDVLTNILKKDIVAHINEIEPKYQSGGFELTPSFQALRKMEYSTGKSGIGTFALGVTNHALTQATHLCITHSYLGKIFNFKQLDDIVGRDGYKIADWLSAMVNAHVDVAKDPYILTLNVNKATYNHVNYLLRSGVGEGTFSFIAQPVLKRYAAQVVANNGMYGVPKEKNAFAGNSKILKDLQLEYAKMFLSVAKKVYSDPNSNLDKEQKSDIKNLYTQIGKLVHKVYVGGKRDMPDWEKLFGDYKQLDIFDVDTGKSMMKPVVYNQDGTIDYIHLMNHYLYQTACAQGFFDLKKCSDALSKLVTRSRIDTKKFGNSIPLQINFLNDYMQLKYDENANEIFYIRNEQGEDGDHSFPLRTYFEKTFLDKKLKYATSVTRMILANQTFTATTLYNKIFNSVMASIYGASEFIVQKYVDGNLTNTAKFGYNSVNNSDTVEAIGNAIDTIFRHRAFMYYLQNRAHNNADSGTINFEIDQNPENISKKINQLIFGDSKQMSVPKRIADLKTQLTKRFLEYDNIDDVPQWLYDLCNDDGSIRNYLLNYINPLLAKKGSDQIDRLILDDSSMDVSGNFKNKICSAFTELLELSTDIPEDVDFVNSIRDLAQDLVLYAYYTTYNNSAVNQIFDVVPVKYRSAYDKGLSYVLKSFWLNKDSDFMASILGSSIDTENSENMTEGQVYTYDITKFIARNFWWNENIVPRYIRRFGVTFGKAGLSQPKNDQIIQSNAGKISAFATSTEDSMFVTIEQKNGDINLYQKVGEQVLISSNPDKPNTSYKSVYKMVPKFGIYNGKTKIYEFYGSADGKSIFSKNNLNKGEDVTLQTIVENSKMNEQEFIKKSSGKGGLSVYNRNGKSNYKGIMFVPNEAFDSEQYDTTDLTDSDGGDIVIYDDIHVDTDQEAVSKCNQNSNYKINISDYTMLDSQKFIDNILKDMNDQHVTDSTLDVYIYGEEITAKNSNVKSNQIQQYIIEIVNNYEKQLRFNQEDALTEDEINQYVNDKYEELKELPEDKIKIECRKYLISNGLSKLFNELDSKGIDIESIFIDSTKNLGDAIKDFCNSENYNYTRYTTENTPTVSLEDAVVSDDTQKILSDGVQMFNDMGNNVQKNVQIMEAQTQKDISEILQINIKNDKNLTDAIEPELTSKIGVEESAESLFSQIGESLITDEELKEGKKIKDHCKGE